jgi:hypothetical protein
MAFVVYYMSSCHFFLVLFRHESSFDHAQQLTNLTPLFLKFSTMDSFVHVSINVNFSNVLCVYGHSASYGSSINIINMGVEQEGPFGTSANNALTMELLLNNLKM